MLGKRGLKADLQRQGEGDLVIKQEPEPGTPMPPGGTVKLHLGKDHGASMVTPEKPAKRKQSR